MARTVGVDGKPRLLQAGDKVTRGMELASVRKADYQQKLAEARALVAEASAAREQAQINYDRATALMKSDTIAKAESDAARVQLDAASARQQGARARLDEAQTAVGAFRGGSPREPQETIASSSGAQPQRMRQDTALGSQLGVRLPGENASRRTIVRPCPTMCSSRQRLPASRARRPPSPRC